MHMALPYVCPDTPGRESVSGRACVTNMSDRAVRTKYTLRFPKYRPGQRRDLTALHDDDVDPTLRLNDRMGSANQKTDSAGVSFL
jgi:hypothetical protein